MMKPTLEKVLLILQDLKPYLYEEWGITKLAVFGSFANETATELSDVDLVVEFERPVGWQFMELCDFLEDRLSRKVDVLTMTALAHIRNRTVAENIIKSLIYV